MRQAHQAQHHAGQEPAQLRRRRSRRARQQHHDQPERAHRRRPWPAEHRRGPDRRLPTAVTATVASSGQFGKGIWLVRRQRRQDPEQPWSRSSFDEGIFTDETERPRADPGQPDQLAAARGTTPVDADGIDARGDGVRVLANTIRHSNDDGIDVNGSATTGRRQPTWSGSVHDGIDVDSHGVRSRTTCRAATATTGSGSAGRRAP